MEKVKVVKAIPGILEVGDVLVREGNDFIFIDEHSCDGFGCERSVYFNVDKETVYENIPTYFVFEVDDSEIEVVERKLTAKEISSMLVEKEVIRTPKEIAERVKFFEEMLDWRFNTEESKVVFQNMLWFIEWLHGERDLLK
jgi:hypothetical protein